MPGNIVTVPANLRHPTGQEFVMIAAMGGMTIQTVFIHRRMGPHEGASFLGMALVAEFIDGIPLELGGAKASMVFMAVCAFYFSFPDGMVGSPVLLGPYALMAEITKVRLGRL